MSEGRGAPRSGLRPRYARRVGPQHVGRRVSVRHLTDDPERGPVPTDVVGRLLGMDDDALLIVDRDGRLRVVGAAGVVSSRVVPEHPRLEPEPHVGTPTEPLRREAARVLLLDHHGRALLVAHAPTPDRRVWTAPGGGLERDESHHAAARRELTEELGIDVEVGPWVWQRRVTFAFRGVWIDQTERWYLAADAGLDPAAAPLDDPGAIVARWWSVDDLRTTDDEVAPGSLADHLGRLLTDGPPDDPVDVGR